MSVSLENIKTNQQLMDIMFELVFPVQGHGRGYFFCVLGWRELCTTIDTVLAWGNAQFLPQVRFHLFFIAIGRKGLRCDATHCEVRPVTDAERKSYTEVTEDP